MGRLEVQGIVSVADGLPRVQFRQLNDKDEIEVQWSSEIMDAREMAHSILEACFNAIYDAALVDWLKETFPDDDRVIAVMLPEIRTHRADRWGLPDQPEDWRPNG